MLLFFKSAGITWDKGSRPLLTPQVDPPLEATSSAQRVSFANTSPEGYKILFFASGPESGRKMLPSLQLHDMIQPSITQVTSNGYFVLELRKTAVNVGEFSPCVLAGQITIHWRPHAIEFGLPSVKAIPGTVGGPNIRCRTCSHQAYCWGCVPKPMLMSPGDSTSQGDMLCWLWSFPKPLDSTQEEPVGAPAAHFTPPSLTALFPTPRLPCCYWMSL